MTLIKKQSSRSCWLLIVTALLASIVIYFLHRLVLQRIWRNSCPLKSGDMCPTNEQATCPRLGRITTYSPCFPSTLLDSAIACHDSYACEEPSKRTTTSPTTANQTRRAFFSALYTDNKYLGGALLLGYSLKKYHPQYPMYMMHFDKALSERTMCSLRQVGWQLRPVVHIPPPLSGYATQFVHQFNKLALWNMTEFDSIIYLDADTLVLADIAHLHELVADPSRTGFELAAVADSWAGKFAYHFNAGVLVLHPSTAVFKELMRTMHIEGNYEPTMAEQAFLNAFFQLRYLQLPVIYNVNLDMYSGYPKLWLKLEQDFKVIHFTLVKPFVDPSKDYSDDVRLTSYRQARKEYASSEFADRVKRQCG